MCSFRREQKRAERGARAARLKIALKEVEQESAREGERSDRRKKESISGGEVGTANKHSQSLTSLCVMLYRAEKPSFATAMSVWKERDSRPEDDWISGGIFVPQYRPIRGATADTQIKHVIFHYF